MPLTVSPDGFLKPYTREGTVTLLKKTTGAMLTIEKAAQELEASNHRLKVSQDPEQELDELVDMQLAAQQISASSKVIQKQLKAVLKVATDYQTEASK